MGSVSSRLSIITMIAFKLVICVFAVPAHSLPSPAGGVGGVVGGHGGDHYNEKPDPFHFQYGVHDDKYYTDFSEVRSGDEAVILRENTRYTFLMGGSNMSVTLLMATMVVLSWMLSMMEKHAIQMSLGMDMVDMCKMCSYLLNYLFNLLEI